MMKKGVSELIAFVLLIGLAVTVGVFVSRWSLQQAQKSTGGIEDMVMGDIQCSDVDIQWICEGTSVKIKNRGTLTIVDFHKDGELMKMSEVLKPNSERSGFSTGVYTPIIKIDEKLVYCSTKKQEFKCS